MNHLDAEELGRMVDRHAAVLELFARQWTESAADVVQISNSLRPPSIDPALTGSIRLDRLLVRLRVIEALRLHAAINGGKLPSALSDITAVPIPEDPITGKPIDYRLDGETAVLWFPSPNSIATFGEITTITLRKPN